jgi:hypothetical protein
MRHSLPLLAFLALSGCQTVQEAYQDVQARAQERAAAADCPDNSTPQCAIPLAIGESDSDAFSRNDVYYRFEVQSPRELVFTLDPIPNTLGVTMEIKNSEYSRVHRSSFKAGHPDAVEVNIRNPGTYYAVLNPSSCCAGANYNYGFSITQPGAPVVVTGATASVDCPKSNTPQCAIPLGVGDDDSSTFTRDDVFYSFDISEPQELKFILDPMPSTMGVTLEIQNSEYNRVHTHRFDRGSPGSTEVDFRSPGRYYLKLNPAACCSGASYDYTIAITR